MNPPARGDGTLVSGTCAALVPLLCRACATSLATQVCDVATCRPTSHWPAAGHRTLVELEVVADRGGDGQPRGGGAADQRTGDPGGAARDVRDQGADDLIVPARTMGPIAASDAGRMFKDDLRALGCGQRPASSGTAAAGMTCGRVVHHLVPGAGGAPRPAARGHAHGQGGHRQRLHARDLGGALRRTRHAQGQHPRQEAPGAC